jgi:hypothetical protein
VALALWEDGYGFEEGSLIDSSGEPVAGVGATIHGGGGYGSDRAWAEGLVGEPIPDRCSPEGVEPLVLIYDVERTAWMSILPGDRSQRWWSAHPRGRLGATYARRTSMVWRPRRWGKRVPRQECP